MRLKSKAMQVVLMLLIKQINHELNMNTAALNECIESIVKKTKLKLSIF